MTSNPKPRKDFAEERQAPQRRIWSEDGLVEDKQQESRTGRGSQDRSERPDRGGRPRGGNRS